MTPRLQKIMEEMAKAAGKANREWTPLSLSDFKSLSDEGKIAAYIQLKIAYDAVTERDKELLESAPEFDDRFVTSTNNLPKNRLVCRVEDARALFDQLRLKLAAIAIDRDEWKMYAEGHRAKADEQEKELASLREELKKQKPLFTRRVLVPELEEKIKELTVENERLKAEFEFKADQVYKFAGDLQAQDALLREALHYIKNHRWFDEDDEFYQKLTAHFWVRGSK